MDAKTGLKEMKVRSSDKLILRHININSVRNKFDSLTYMLEKNVHIFLISETKLDDSLKDGGGLLLYIREDIPSRLLQCKSQRSIESPSIEINLRKRKWFLSCSYNPHRNSISRHLECLNRVIDEHKRTYDNFILIADFNVGIEENSMKNFCYINYLKSLIKIPTCFKNPDKPTCTDLIPWNYNTNRNNM